MDKLTFDVIDGLTHDVFVAAISNSQLYLQSIAKRILRVYIT